MEVSCDNCSKTFNKPPSKVERSEHDFCSRECSDEYQKVQFSGENNPNYRGGGEWTCEYCGDVAEGTPYEASYRKYCSQECMNKALSEKFSGEGNPSWNGGKVTIECNWCGDEKEVTPAKSDRPFCSDECYKSWLSHKYRGNRWVGEDNPAWSGGKERHRFYGPNWQDQRQKVLERDGNECILCGATENLHVHHKTPIDRFDRDTPGWYNLANDTSNLVTLCGSCHKTVHLNVEEYFGDLIG